MSYRASVNNRKYYIGIVMVIFLSFSAMTVYAQVRKDASDNYNMKKLAREAKQNIDKIDKEIAKKENEKRLAERESQAKASFEEGKSLAKEGKKEEAKELFKKAMELTSDPKLRTSIKAAKIEIEKKARDIKVKNQKATS